MALVKGRLPTADGAADAVPRGLTTLLTDLAAPEPGVRRKAARELESYPESAMVLCDRLQVETSPSVRSMLFITLIQTQSSAVAVRLAEFLRSDDAPLRNAAIEALQEMPDAVTPRLQALLVDEDSDVRISAVNILAALRHAQASEWLVGVIRVDPHVNVCAAAVDGLAEIGGPEAVRDLRELRVRFAGDAYMEFAIDTAISRIGVE